MDRKAIERRIVGSLIVLLVVEVTLLGVHLRWGGFFGASSQHEAQLAGHVLKNENELRRRGNNSLVWEKSAGNDAVYFYDSILTLSQSTATLQLFKDTEVHLSENTLVTIEPQDKKGFGEIRLKFVKGSLQARNPFANARVESDTWSMEIKSGSDIDFRQVGENNFELGVNKGEVDFKSASGAAKVIGAQMLRIENDAPVKMQVEESFQWINPPPARIYTHSGEARVALQWHAPHAQELILQTLGEKERVIALHDGAEKEDLNLPVGRHQLFLRSSEKTSAAISVEVWKAPLLHLVSPLPRNRVRTGSETAFVWMSAPGVASYDFLLNGHALKLQEARAENTFATSFSEEDDAEWSVQGKDAQGFSIPALYSYPLFIREAPLAAPKLKSPTLRRPAKADEGASYWWQGVILPEAFADEILYQAVFNWDKVEGADRYVIEISESADFRSPLVNRTVGKNEFIWKKMKLQSYYWRVAAETKNGRLGIFSDPELVDLKNGQQAGVEVTPLANPHEEMEAPKEKPPIIQLGSEEPKPPEEKPALLEVAPPPIQKFELKPRSWVEWRPGFSVVSIAAPQDTRASFQGKNPVSFSAGADRNLAPERLMSVQLNYTRQGYQAKPKEKFPTQEDLTWSEISGQVITHMTSSHLGYGLYAEHSAEIVRKDLESVEARGANYFGPAFQSYFQFGGSEYIGDYSVVVGTHSGLLTRQNLRVPLSRGIYLGGALEGGTLFKSEAHVYKLTGRFTFGFEF